MSLRFKISPSDYEVTRSFDEAHFSGKIFLNTPMPVEMIRGKVCINSDFRGKSAEFFVPDLWSQSSCEKVEIIPELVTHEARDFNDDIPARCSGL